MGKGRSLKKILLMGNLGYQKFLLTGIKPFLKVSLHELSICNYGKRYLFHQKTMEKGIFFSFKYYGNYGKVILKVGGHPAKTILNVKWWKAVDEFCDITKNCLY